MKKIVLVFIVLLIVTGCVNTPKESDAMKFKTEYESLNGQANDAGVLHKEITIPEDNPMIYASQEDIEEMLTSKTGIIYFGFPECPWCRSALPILLEAAEEELMTEILYFNNKSERDVMSLDENGNIVVENEGSEGYYRILDLLGEHASVYAGLEDEQIKRIYYPTVVFVYEGEILGIQVSLASEEDVDPRKELTTEQWNATKNIYKEFMKDVKGACDSSC